MCLKYAYLKMFKRENFIIFDVWGKGLDSDYKNEKILKFVPFRLFKPLTWDKN